MKRVMLSKSDADLNLTEARSHVDCRMAVSSPSTAAAATSIIAPVVMLGMVVMLFLTLRQASPRSVHLADPQVIGTSVEGRPMVCYRFGDRGPTLLVKASIHGTEGAGTPLCQRLIAWLNAHPTAWQACRVLVMPISNPDGLHAGKRFNANGVDLNRNFPAENREAKAKFGLDALSEPESRALYDFILHEKPDLIVAIHQPLNCVDFDGPAPAAALADSLSRSTGLPVEKLGARPGSLGAWFGETLGKPIITLELPRSLTESPDKLWADYGPGLVELIERPHLWKIDIPLLP